MFRRRKKKSGNFLEIVSLFTCILFNHVNCYLIDVTDAAFGSKSDGFLAAFGDFNSDKKTDLFVITDHGKSLSLFKAKPDSPFVKTTLIHSSSSNTTIITGVMPADFDGDSQMDVLVVRHQQGDITGPVTVEIHWGNSITVGLDHPPLTLADKFKDQPLVMDANGDLLPDLLGETVAETDAGKRFYWLTNTQRNITKVQVENSTAKLPPLNTPQSSAFVDLDHDLTPDLMVTSQDASGRVQFEWWINQNGVLKWIKTIPLPALPTSHTTKQWEQVGQAAFTDVDHDQRQDLVLPLCEDSECLKSYIYVYTGTEWVDLDVKFGNADGTSSWGFVPQSKNLMKDLLTVPISVRVGDYNMDGYPDLIAVLHNTQNETMTARTFILVNTGCSTSMCRHLGRSFIVDWDTTEFGQSEFAMVATFFDYEENGNLDVVMVTYVADTSMPHLKVLKAKSTDDFCFLKVMVLSGLCHNSCAHGEESYGVNLPGPTTWYHTVTPEGDPQISTATQMSQSTHFALQTPYIIYGLGQTPNFVEEFSVGIQRPNNTQAKLRRSWTYIIPNSQLIVIPSPQMQPNSWTNKLLITPSELVLLTGAALLGTCGFIAIIVAILHWRERAEDKKEKIQESQRFHFDAM